MLYSRFTIWSYISKTFLNQYIEQNQIGTIKVRNIIVWLSSINVKKQMVIYESDNSKDGPAN